MNDKQFEIIVKKLDKLIALMSIQGIEDKNEKIYLLKKIGLSSEEVGEIVGIKNPRQMEGWKRK